jgi:hypothetical protein
MKIINEIKNKYPQIKLTYKVEPVFGYNEPFHTLYFEDETIIAIMDGYEPKTGKERKELFEIVAMNLKPLLLY